MENIKSIILEEIIYDQEGSQSGTREIITQTIREKGLCKIITHEVISLMNGHVVLDRILYQDIIKQSPLTERKSLINGFLY